MRNLKTSDYQELLGCKAKDRKLFFFPENFNLVNDYFINSELGIER